MEILLVQPKQEVRDLLTFPLESKFSANVTGLTTDEEAISGIEKMTQKIDFIILDNNEETLKKLSSVIQKKSPQPYVIVCGKDLVKEKLKLNGCNILGTAQYANLLEDLVRLIGEAAVENASKEGYCRVRTNLLVQLSPLDVGVFIRLSDSHFVKMFQKGDVFDGEDLRRYTEKKKVQNLHLENSDAGVFVGKLNAKLLELLKSEKVDPVAATETLDDAVDSIHSLVNQLGITPEVQETVENSVKATMKIMGDFPQLSNILKNLQTNREKYISSHSMMLGQLACAVAVAMDWYSDATFQKLTMAAFLHDVGITNNELCAVKSLEEFDKKFKGKFNVGQVEEYKKHPEKGAILLGQFKDLPAEVDKVILQHHEHPYGTGFPNALNGNYISPLSALFIVSHDLVDHIFDKGGQPNLEEFLSENDKKYGQGNFKKVARAIATMAL
jgi:HD-GYP domain-containing protein (c-di-GMP phosphodiesterase class II)